MVVARRDGPIVPLRPVRAYVDDDAVDDGVSRRRHYEYSFK